MHARSSSPTRDQTWAPCIGSAESYPLDHQGSSNILLCISLEEELGLCFTAVLLFLFLNKFIYLFLAVLGLRCCVWAFYSCGEQQLLFHCSTQASHCGGFSCCGAQTLGARISVVVAHGLSSCSSRALEHRLSTCGAGA